MSEPLLDLDPTAVDRGPLSSSRRSSLIWVSYVAMALCALAVGALGRWLLPRRASVAMARAAHRFITRAIWHPMRWLLGIRRTVSGAPPPRHAGVGRLYVANHQSYLDGATLLAVLPPARYLCSSHLVEVPIFGGLIRMSQAITVDRDSLGDRQQAATEIAETLRRGEDVFLFPNGHRRTDETQFDFRHGAFVAAMWTGALVVPVVLRGTGAALPRGSARLRAGVHVRVDILDALDPGGHRSARAMRDDVVRRMKEAYREG
jgi:1-acyl-sn-glycerol-3-phosphate acyltransferase